MRFAIVTLCFMLLSVGVWAEEEEKIHRDVDIQPFEYIKVQMGDSLSKVTRIVEKSANPVMRNIHYSDSQRVLRATADYADIKDADYAYYFDNHNRLEAVVIYAFVDKICESWVNPDGTRWADPAKDHKFLYPMAAFNTAKDSTLGLYGLDFENAERDNNGDPFNVFKIDDKRIIRISVRCRMLHIQYSNAGVEK